MSELGTSENQGSVDDAVNSLSTYSFLPFRVNTTTDLVASSAHIVRGDIHTIDLCDIAERIAFRKSLSRFAPT